MLALSFPLLLLAPVASTNTESAERLLVTTNRPLSWLQTPAATSYRSFENSLPSHDLATLLVGSAGLQADARSNLAQDSKLSMRGFGSRSAFGVRGIRLTLDGIPLTTVDGQTQPSGIMLSDLAAVEVLKGPFAALHGNAGGGVIALTSRAPEPGLIKFATSASGEQQIQQLLADTGLGTIAIQSLQSDGHRPWNKARRQQALYKHETTLADNLHWQWRFDYLNDGRLDDPGSLTLEQWRTDPQQTLPLASRFNSHKSGQQQQFATLLRADSWQLSAWQQQRNISQYLTQSGEAISSSGGIVDLARIFRGFEWQQKFSWQQFNWQWSARIQRGEDKRQGYVNQFGQLGDLRRDERNQTASAELAIQLHYPLSANWQTYSGMRASQLRYTIRDYFIVSGNPDDSGSVDFSDSSHALGILYQQDDWSWYLSSGIGFETPTLTELAYRNDGIGPNLNLSSSRYRQIDSGIKTSLTWSALAVQLQFDLFSITNQNELVIDSSTNGRTVYRNAANSSRHGAELTTNINYNAWALSYQANLINANLQQEQLSLPSPGLADFTQWAQLSWSAADALQTQLQLQWQTSSAIPLSDQNQLQSTGYQLWHLNAEIAPRWHDVQWRLFVRLDNLTDESYPATVVVNQTARRYIEPGTPRQFSAGIGLSFQLF